MAPTLGSTRTRRSFLAALLGGVGVSAAQMLGRPSAAFAGSDGDVVLGGPNDSGSTTILKNTLSSATVLQVTTDGHGIESVTSGNVAVIGVSGVGATYPSTIEPSTGVYGLSLDGAGVYGASGNGPGVYAASHAVGVAAMVGQGNEGTGVHGVTGDVSGRPAAPRGVGVYGSANGAGIGIRGASDTGTAVHAATANPMSGYALRAVGRVRLDNAAGLATIVAGKRSVVVTPGIDLVATSAVVATLQGYAGGRTTVHRVAVDATKNQFTIWLTAESTATVKIAWHVFG